MELSLWLLGFSTFCKKAWAKVKKNWKFFVGFGVSLALVVIFRKKIDLKKVNKRLNDDHQRELDLIETAREEELRKIRLANKQYIETVQEIEKQYEKQLNELSDLEREKIQEILYESGNDPEVLTGMLAAKFKFRVIDGGIE